MDGFFHAFDACLLALAHGACWVEALFLISTCAPFVAPLFIMVVWWKVGGNSL